MKQQLDEHLLKRRLTACTSTYADHAAVQREITARLLARLDYIRHSPTSILLACIYPDSALKMLKKRFPKAQITVASLLPVPPKRWWQRSKSVVELTSAHLPFSENQFDFVCMPLLLAAVNDWPRLLHECQRVLQPAGLLLFSSVGPDTLKELDAAFTQVGLSSSVHTFVDMHDTGDMCVQAGFEHPVMDMSPLTVHYTQLNALWDDLKLTAANAYQIERKQQCVSPRQWAKLQAAYPRDEAGYPATVEVVMGHAWAAVQTKQQSNQSEITISIDQIKRD